jgi:hypothetical protein
LPHRIYDAAKYPLHSVNGSTILLYGHENGVRVLWKGGRPFKEPFGLGAGGKAKTNGSSNDAVMILDSDDDMSGSQAAPFEDKPEFEDEEEESNPSKPYPPIIQHLDLNFGAAALHLDVSPVSISILDAGHAPPMFKDKIVFAAACSDNLIRVITLPLTPPSPASKSRQEVQYSFTAGNAGNGLWGESVVELSGFSMYPDGVSMTFINAKSERELVRRVADDRERTRSTSMPRSSGDEWHILVASHSRESTGLLLLHNIPIIETQRGGETVYSLSRDYSLPSQTQYLPSPSITISFNPSVSSSQSTHILLADRSGACRIYDCQPPRSSRSSGNPSLNASGNQQGVWLLTLYAGFQSNKLDSATAAVASSTGNFGRKNIVDAKWVMAGKAIMVLLANSEWGIWDIEEVGPEVSKGILTPQGVRGGALTTFSISGWIDGAPVKSSSSRASMSQSSTSRFAPMTPGTRKLAEPVLFSGRSGGHCFTRGGISVTRLLTASTISILDECVAFWLEDSYAVIPSLRAFWDAQARRNKGVGSGNLLSGGNSTGRAIRLEGVNLRGERCCGIRPLSQKSPSPEFGLPTEILIIGEHRYIMMSNQDPKSYIRWETVSRLETHIIAPGELDVMEIDQVLSQMENNPPFAHTKGKGRLLT